MRILLGVLLFLTALPSHSITGFKPPDQLINPLIDELLSDAESLLSLKIPEERPEVILTTKDQLVKAYCENRNVCNVAAVTDNKTGKIYLDIGLELNNVYNVSLLYHELIHFIQVKNKLYDHLNDCERWALSEMHAYKAQSQWLIVHGFRGFRVPDLSDQCH